VPLDSDDDLRATAMTSSAVRAGVGGAAAGMAEPGETSEKTRLRVFDKHLAARLKRQTPVILASAIASAGVAIVLTGIATSLLHAIGGFSGLKQIDLAALRAQRFGMLGDAHLLFIVTGGLSVAFYLCAIGELLRFVAACRAIAAVNAGALPEVVGVIVLTRIGLLLASVLCPPFGIIMGVLLKLPESNELRELGGQMILLGAIAVAAVLASVLWDIMAEMATRHKPLSTVSP